MQSIIGQALMVLGILIIGWTAYKLNGQRDVLKLSERAVGVFVGYEYSGTSRSQLSNDTESGFAGQVNSKTTSPKVKFTTKEGKEIIFVNSASLSDEADRNHLEVLYSLDDPENAIVNDYFGMWGWLFVIGGFGLIFMLVGLLLWKVL
jgi:hypothetical protein